MTSRRAFSLLELMVATVLLLLALAIASRLIVDAQASIAHSGRRHLDLSVELAFDVLRYDARASDGFAGTSGASWVDGQPLRFLGHVSGAVVAYEVADGELVRRLYAAGASEPTATRPVLRRVDAFRFRLAPGTVRPSLEVEVTYRETPPLTARTAGGQAAAVTSAPRVVGLVLTPRWLEGSAPGSWW